MFNIKHNLTTLAHLFLAIFGIFGVTISSVWLSNNYEKCGAALLLCIIVGYVLIDRQKRIRVFKAHSPELAAFFGEWYAKEGELTLFCTDLEWIDSTDTVFKALILKAEAGKLRLYLGVVCEKAKRLKQANAKLYQVPHSIVSPHRFSILKTDGFERIICRNKSLESADAGTEMIEFIDTSTACEPYLVALARDLLKFCTNQL